MGRVPRKIYQSFFCVLGSAWFACTLNQRGHTPPSYPGTAYRMLCPKLPSSEMLVTTTIKSATTWGHECVCAYTNMCCNSVHIKVWAQSLFLQGLAPQLGIQISAHDGPQHAHELHQKGPLVGSATPLQMSCAHAPHHE